MSFCRQTIPVVLSITVFVLASGVGLGREEPSDPITPTEPIALFNGKDLEGWHSWLAGFGTDDPRDVFAVRDGLLRISGDGYGYLRTARTYRDYRFVVEYRWGERNRPERKSNARDSGIFLHAVGPDGNSYDGGGAYMAAIECQVMQGAVGDLMLIKGRDHDGRDVPVRLTAHAALRRDADGWPFWNPDGSRVTLAGTGRLNWRGKDPTWKDVLDIRGPDDAESPHDEWTRVECVCREATVQVRVNGRLVNEATDVFPSVGHILLQCEGSEIMFRRVELHPLREDGAQP